jgi:energy-coupling factor transport system substrate-specific component
VGFLFYPFIAFNVRNYLMKGSCWSMTKYGQGASPKGLKLTDILVTIVIAVVFGIIYKLWGPMYDVVKPIGVHAEQTIYGMWFIAGTFAYLITRKPGVAILAEVAAASVSALLGSEWGISTLYYGLLQGLGAEIIFAIFLYRNASVWVVSLAAIGAAAGSLVLDFGYGYIESLSTWNYTLLIGLRVIGSIVIAGIFAYYLSKALELTGVTKVLRPGTEKDYEALNRA